MNMLFTRWLYPLERPIPLSESPHFVLDNPRSDEIAEVATLLEENYYHQPEGFFPPSADEQYVSLEWMISQFRMRFGPSDPYFEKILAEHESDSVFESFARIWIVARYDNESVEKEHRRAAEQMPKDGQHGFSLLEDDNPIIRNPPELQNYLSILSLLIHSQGADFSGCPILVGSGNYRLFEGPFDKVHWWNAFITFGIFSSSDYEEPKSDLLAWRFFPYVRKRLIEMRDALARATAGGHGELLMYIGNILRVVECDARDDRVRFILLISLLELLLTHNPDTSRYNVEDSINRQFRLKTAIMVRRQHPDTDLESLDKRLKKLYGLRCAIAHGDFKAVARFERGLSKKEGEEEYVSDIVVDCYFYLRAVMEQFLEDPEFVLFLKKS